MTSSSSSPSGSINALQIALVSMKERCTRQQKRVEELERENLLMAEVRADLYNEVKRLHETNVKLREKNLLMNHELRVKSNECVEVREKLAKCRTNNSSNVRQLERLQNEVSMIANRRRRASLNNGEGEEDTLPSLSSHSDNIIMDSDSGQSTHEQEDAGIKLLEKTNNRMAVVKQALLVEQQAIMEAIQTLKQKQANSAQNAEKVISASIAAAHKMSLNSDVQNGGLNGERRCPMCEIAFPQNVSHDQFESHVVEHFSYEESETLTNFDLVPDASSECWQGEGQQEESMYR